MARQRKAGVGTRGGRRQGKKRQNREVPPVVGVGASAGGVNAFQTFVRHVPADSGIAWVLIQHMAPDRESQLHDILSHRTGLPVTQVVEDTPAEPDRIYVIAPGNTMTLREGTLRPVSDRDPLARRTSIDAFFLSLAEDQGERAGCALLSGAGTDGTIGLKAVKEAGGLTLTQTLGTAEYDSMLLSAVRTGLVDREMSVEEMPGAFADFLVHHRLVARESVGDGDRLQVCHALRAVTGHDFSGYKSSTVDRRVRRRMQMLGIPNLPEYLARIEEDKGEATHLFRDMLIGVTQFFRDPDAFAAVAKTAIPKILDGKTADDEIRIWVSGCATGEEVYSLAMLFHEQSAGLDSVPDFRIFGSDIDENALHFARLGRYPKGIAADVSPERLERFFETEDGTYCVRSALRENCLFAQHNLLRDPPFSRIDLISCRNVLIYMNPDLQRRLMPVFHYALRPGGYLFLGPAESASQAPKLFAEVDRKNRIFSRIGASARLPDFPIAAGDGRERARDHAVPTPAVEETAAASDAAARIVLERHAPAYVVIDSDYDILEASARTGPFLELASGRPRMNLSSMARSGLAVDVRAAVDRVMATGKSETRTGVQVGTGGERRHLTLVVEPLPGGDRSAPRYLVVFREEAVVGEMPARRPVRSGDEEVVRALELELQTTKERLQSTLEELETSNEELRTSNEELSSVNEELQSSNEELETSKEELQSINEELRTVNNELSDRVEELSRANNDLKNLFANTRIAMLFLDRDFRIMNFTPAAKPLFHLRDHDLGRPLDELAGRVDYEALKHDVRTVLGNGKALEREVQAAGGEEPQTFIMRILPYRDAEERIRGSVVTLVDITQRKRDEERLASMVSELNHRVKNAMAGVQAMMHQSRVGAASVEEYSERLEGRLLAMAAAHAQLAVTSWEHADLAELARNVLSGFSDGDERLTVSGPNIELRPEIVVPVGMILHELATNAAKYGAWSVPEGSVTLHWEYLQGDGRTLRLYWEERGGPPAREPQQPGFGLRFVQQSTRHDLHGSCRPAFRDEGFRCDFEVPARKITYDTRSDRSE